MFNLIRDTSAPRPWVTYMFMLCAAGITLGSLAIPEMERFFGSYDENTTNVQRFTLAFQHGIDDITASLQLALNLFILFHIGQFTEKLLGSMRFFIVTITAMVVYACLHYLFDMAGRGMLAHGSSGVIWAYSPIVFVALFEGRKLKTRVIFEEHFKLLRNIIYLMWTAVSVFMTITVLLYSEDMSILEAIFKGNLFHLSGVSVGCVFALLWKKDIRTELRAIGKYKKIKQKPIDNIGMYFSITFPVFLAIVYLTAKM
jgi:membrane associated rhomboid family serine protease